MSVIKEKRFVLPCGHNNAGKLNLYPFKTWFCFDCGLQTDYIKKVKWMIKSTKFRNKITGEIKTQILITELKNYEKGVE